MNNLFYLPFLFTLIFSLGINAQKKDSSEKDKKEKKEKTYEDIITKEAISDEGLFKVHKVKDKYFYEISDSLLGRDMLMVTRIVKMATELPLSRHKMSEQVLKWEKFDDNIFLKQASYSKFANDSLPISIAVSNSNYEPIISSFDIVVKNKDNNSYVIDVTDLYKSDVKMFGFPQSSRKGYKITSLDSKLSFIESIRSFPLNIETKHIKTYKSSDSRNGQISMVLNNSMILLPKEPMKRRYFDQRVGWFTSAQTDYGIDNQEAETVRYLDRWRLEVKDEDVEKYKNGELVEPKKPIIYYLDPATPEKWRKYLKAGIEDWNVAFEAAGFKNAVIVKYPPDNEEDPDWSPEDIRYSTVRYLASPSLNANGPHVSDPRSGEIIESDINWYHNVMKLLRNWYFVQTAAVNPDSRSVEFKNEVMGELIRFVSSHEFGHTIGLPHNMGSSSAYPVDSLRSSTFTKKFGTAPSIMDYARFNYVAQPEDEGVALMPSQWDTPNVGIYDIYAVKWGYKPILGVSEEEEKSILRSWISEKADDLKYRFGSAGIDPSSQTEDLGDNAVKASEYGIKNLKRIMPKLIDWTTEDGETYSELEYMYGQVLGQFGRYMGHVSNNIGGIYQYYKTSDQNGAVYTHVKKSHQQNCMNFINNQLFETPTWIINKEILNKIEFAGITNRIRSTQSRTLNSLLDFSKMARLIENEAINGRNAYSLIEMMKDLRKGIFKEIYKNGTIDVYRRNLQLAYLDRISYLMSNEQESTPSWARTYITSVKVSQSDIRTVAANELIELRKDLKKHKSKSDKMTSMHIEMLKNKIASILSGKPI
ncbi:MAG: zinc-dependent metalloprotease [Flavobacteriaceae bacterium]|nr:zinc-dependent metalloprotease [Flavobacteriaceae bacterium]